MNERTFGKKICVWCGKEFIARSPKQNSCKDDHYRPCIICGKPLLVKESYANFMKNGGGRCCPSCKGKKIHDTRASWSPERKDEVNAKRKQTTLERYGVEYVMQSEVIQQRAKQSVQDKYGVQNVSQLSQIQDKIKENSRVKYGVDHYSNAPAIRSKMEQGMLSKYGVSNAMKSSQLKEKARNTNIQKYGVPNVAQNEDVKQKIKTTCLDKYGVEYAAQSDEIKAKRIQTNMQKYGAPGYVFSAEFLATQMLDPAKHEQAEQFRADPKQYLSDNYSDPPTYQQVAKDTGLSETSISYHVLKNNLKEMISYNVSSMEQEVVEYIHSISDVEIDIHNRSIIQPKELDIYIPEKHLAFECNPSASHNADIGLIDQDAVISPSYHRFKSDQCKDKGIRLFHLFGYDWVNHQSVMKSMIRNALGCTTTRYFARKLEVQEVSWKDAMRFLELNHRQGRTSCSVRLGLYDNDRLVSLMTFGRLKPTQGASSTNTDTWELSRFCSLLDCTVVGGASKLLHHFIDSHPHCKIVSFSDIATTSGKLYESLGFYQIHQTDPSYVWVDIKTEQYYNRVSCQKRNLRKLFNDDTIDIENKTEAQIMLDHGYVRVYDSGLIKWELDI